VLEYEARSFLYERGKVMSSDTEVRPIGVAMSDGSVRPFSEVLGGVRELSERRNLPKSTVATWWARGRAGLTIHPFPKPVFRPSTGPLFFLPDIDSFVPGTSKGRDDGDGNAA
jgi:hypothetical protein